jgi:hypothetical protein
VLGAALAVVLRSGEIEYRNGALLALGLGAAALAIPLLAAIAPGNDDYVLDRNLLPAWLPLALVVAAALGLRGRHRVALLCTAVICLTLVVCDFRLFTDAKAKRDDWRGVARALGQPHGGARVIAVAPQWEGFALKLYVPGLNPMRGPARAIEIDAITYYGLVPDTRGRTPVPGAPFRSVGTRRIQRMVVTRYRAPRPTAVYPASLTNLGLPPFVAASR